MPRQTMTESAPCCCSSNHSQPTVPLRLYSPPRLTRPKISPVSMVLTIMVPVSKAGAPGAGMRLM
jgi:hypothetical protein